MLINNHKMAVASMSVRLILTEIAESPSYFALVPKQRFHRLVTLFVFFNLTIL